MLIAALLSVLPVGLHLSPRLWLLQQSVSSSQPKGVVQWPLLGLTTSPAVHAGLHAQQMLPLSRPQL